MAQSMKLTHLSRHGPSYGCRTTTQEARCMALRMVRHGNPAVGRRKKGAEEDIIVLAARPRER